MQRIYRLFDVRFQSLGATLDRVFSAFVRVAELFTALFVRMISLPLLRSCLSDIFRSSSDPIQSNFLTLYRHSSLPLAGYSFLSLHLFNIFQSLM